MRLPHSIWFWLRFQTIFIDRTLFILSCLCLTGALEILTLLILTSTSSSLNILWKTSLFMQTPGWQNIIVMCDIPIWNYGRTGKARLKSILFRTKDLIHLICQMWKFVFVKENKTLPCPTHSFACFTTSPDWNPNMSFKQIQIQIYTVYICTHYRFYNSHEWNENTNKNRE